MKLAVTYICTGKYSIFWKEFYRTSEQYFYPGIEKKYFVFTDNEELIRSCRDDEKVMPYFQRWAGWPYDTLLRFNTFCMVQDVLADYDYCYYWNANTVFLRPIDENVIPFPTQEQELVLWRHTLGYDYDRPEQFNAEKNPKSEAYVESGTFCRSYGGGFLGGTSRGFIKMSIVLRDKIAADLVKGLIATQHDQSHIVKYGTQVKAAEVMKNAVVSEEYMKNMNPYAIFVNKKHYGGMHALRKMPLSFRIKDALLNAGRVFLDIIGIKSVLKKVLKRRDA